MTGTKAGGLKAAATNKARYGNDYFRAIGYKGGQNGHTGGFAANRRLASIAGSLGGRLGKRKPAAYYQSEEYRSVEAARQEALEQKRLKWDQMLANLGSTTMEGEKQCQ